MKTLTVKWWVALLLCAASGLAGWSLRSSSEKDAAAASPPSIPQRQPPPPSTASLSPGPGSSDPPSASAAASDKTAASTKTPAERLHAALHCRDRVERLQGFLTALGAMTPENAAEFHEVWRIYRGEGHGDSGLSTYYNFRSGEVEGVKTLAPRTGRPIDYRSIAAINDMISGAMKTDPAGVRTWYDSLTDENFRERLFEGYVSALAAHNPAGAVDLLAKIDPSLQARSASAMVGSFFRKADGAAGVTEGFRSIVAAAPEHENAPWMPLLFKESVRQTTAVPSTTFAANLMEEYAGKPFADLSGAGKLGEKYASWQPVAALEWATRMDAKIPNAENPSSILTTSIAGISDPELRTAADWCLQRPPGPHRTAALTAMATRAARTDPALASELQQAANTPPAP